MQQWLNLFPSPEKFGNHKTENNLSGVALKFFLVICSLFLFSCDSSQTEKEKNKAIKQITQLPENINKYLSVGDSTYKARQIAECHGGAKMLIEYAVNNYKDVDKVEISSSALLYTKDNPRPALEKMLQSKDINQRGVAIEIIGTLRYPEFRSSIAKLVDEKTEYRKSSIGEIATKTLNKIDYRLKHPEEINKALEEQEKLSRTPIVVREQRVTAPHER